jgi:outer membrane protein OmpA-like peptidoglycan-associated protein/tetratricopeptide (TPR) repeat protein
MKYIVSLLILALSLPTFAQQKEEKSGSSTIMKYPKAGNFRKKRLAKKLIKEGSYYNAALYLEDVHKAKPTQIKVTHTLAELNRFLRDYKAAEGLYKEVIEQDKGKFVDDNYYYAQMLKMNGKYEEAKSAFEDFLKIKDSEITPRLKSLARVDITGCDTALALMKTPSKILVEHNAAISRQIQDASPKPYGKTILYTSQKTDTAVNLSSTQADHYASLFTADRNGKEFSNITSLPTPPNDAAAHVANGIYNADQSVLIYTRCSQDLIDSMKCKLYRMSKKNGSWEAPEELTSLNAKGGTNTQPAWGVDKDGKAILYFVSDRGGRGGLDIFYASVNNDGTFGTVESAGPEINTQGDDVTPHYDGKNKQLYFSSTGHPGFGGLDVFRIPGTPGNWGKVANAGSPINTSYDDFYFAIDEKAKGGYMVSNRVGSKSNRGETCCDDIWNVTIQRDVFLKGVYVKRGDASMTPIAGVDAAFYKVNGNNFDFVGSEKTNSGPFVFQVDRGKSYKLNGNKEGFWPAVDNLSVTEEEDRDTIYQIFYLDPIIRKKIRIENVYFAFDKSNVLQFYKTKIDSVVALLKANPGYGLEVQGHTDSKGSDQYNEALSKRRADEVKKYLVKVAKIAENRIIVKNYGETSPALPNETPDGQDDPEARSRNRRVEFKILPDKPDDSIEFEYVPSELDAKVKTGPGFKK